jgi:hypothetical protein
VWLQLFEGARGGSAKKARKKEKRKQQKAAKKGTPGANNEVCVRLLCVICVCERMG